MWSFFSIHTYYNHFDTPWVEFCAFLLNQRPIFEKQFNDHFIKLHKLKTWGRSLNPHLPLCYSVKQTRSWICMEEGHGWKKILTISVRDWKYPLLGLVPLSGLPYDSGNATRIAQTTAGWIIFSVSPDQSTNKRKTRKYNVIKKSWTKNKIRAKKISLSSGGGGSFEAQPFEMMGKSWISWI